MSGAPVVEVVKWDDNFTVGQVGGKDFLRRSRTGQTKQRQKAGLRQGMFIQTTEDAYREPTAGPGRNRRGIAAFPEQHFPWRALQPGKREAVEPRTPGCGRLLTSMMKPRATRNTLEKREKEQKNGSMNGADQKLPGRPARMNWVFAYRRGSSGWQAE